MDYGSTDVPQSVTEYEYDELERVKEVSHYNNWTNETVRYGYLYASDGNLAAITKNGEPAYSYEYDSLGRLIHSSMLENGKAVLYTGHTYDTSDRILSQSWQIGEDAFTESYVYEEKDGTLKQMNTGGDTLTFTYDELKRFNQRTFPVMTVDYDYKNCPSDSKKTTTQVSRITYKDENGTGTIIPALGYTYDVQGNIKNVTSGGTAKQSYIYDEQNQLKRETLNDYKGGTLYGTYTYDTYGNIRSITSSLSGIENESYTLEYGNTSWIDRLTKVTYTDKNGNTSSGNLTYDRIGNPERYFNGHKTWDFTWKFGRQLTGASSGSSVISYAYDVDGIRQSKTVNGSTTKFTTLDGKVVRETTGGVTVDYFYDNEGKPYKLEVAGSAMNYVGYYVLNQQGDVVAILDDTGNVAVTYEYNAWGKILAETGTGTLVSTYLKSYNRLKYRGYYYDAETGFYYLNSRYYDPVIGRFINADTTISTGQGFIGCNMYTYCLNNPINYVDYTGYEAVAIQSMFEWWSSGMWWLCAGDGAFPVGDIIYLGGIIVFGTQSLYLAQANAVPEMVVELPVSDVDIYSRTIEDTEKSVEKAVAKADAKVNNNKKRYDYWIVNKVNYGNGYCVYIPIVGVSFSKALSVVRGGGDILASSERNAYKLARAAGYGRTPTYHSKHHHKNGSIIGYRRHYHDGLHKGGHIFYV